MSRASIPILNTPQAARHARVECAEDPRVPVIMARDAQPGERRYRGVAPQINGTEYDFQRGDVLIVDGAALVVSAASTSRVTQRTDRWVGLLLVAPDPVEVMAIARLCTVAPKHQAQFVRQQPIPQRLSVWW